MLTTALCSYINAQKSYIACIPYTKVKLAWRPVPMNLYIGPGWTSQSVTLEPIVRYAQKSLQVNWKSQSTWHHLLISHFSRSSWTSFHAGIHGYSACADRLTGWLIQYHLTHGQANRFIETCYKPTAPQGTKQWWYGGPPFTSLPFKQFLEDWAVKYRLSSATHPQSNGRAELAIKSAKWIVNDNSGAWGSLNNNRAARAIL